MKIRITRVIRVPPIQSCQVAGRIIRPSGNSGEIMSRKQPDYLSYLLRLWQTEGKEEITWRASLERADTRERVGFACLEELCAFLQKQSGTTKAGGTRNEP